MRTESTTTQENDILLSCENLNFSYRDRQVLRNISLQFKKGEFIALLGRNGAGKSTLLSCLAGLQPCEADHLLVGGMNPARAGRAEVARRVSLVPQEHGELFPYTVLDVVVMGRTPFIGYFGSPTKEDYQLARDVLAELFVDYLTDRVYTTLSGGEMQMVNVARALVQTRRMVFLDEPTNHLDYRNRYQILQSLKRQCIENDSCIVACLHDPNHAYHFADKVILLDRGTVAAKGETREVLTAEAVSRLYDIPVGRCERNIEPRFSQADFKSQTLLLVGASGEGKTTLLQQLLAGNGEKRLGGIVSPGTWRADRRYSQDVVNIESGERLLFARRQNGDGSGPFQFFPEGQELADRALQAEQYRDADCVIIDEVGPLELRGGGHGKHLSALLSLSGVKHIWSVRPTIVSEVCSRWMLPEPHIVYANDPQALEKMQDFIENIEVERKL